ncbi:hypothetical protein [Arthrospira platensis]|uniref:hypothetical protein n=1 Tax=Limnospira platensis TaxID=118562 RepID=UPI002570CCDB|nr:hypothetical protein [Arthrospira platensis]
MEVFRSRKLGESPENGKSPVGRVILISPTHITVSGLSWKCGGFQESEVGRVSRKRKVTSWESYSHITYPHNSFRVELEMWRFSEVRNWESYSNIAYPHNSFPVELEMWRFSGVGSWESLPKTESHELRELLSYNLPT